MPDLPDDQPREPIRGGWEPRRVFEVTLGVPVIEGNSVEVLRNGDQIFPAMLREIDAAQRSIDMLTFVYWTGDIAVRFARSLSDAARRGVRVRVLLDQVGARRIDDELIEQMGEAGCDVRWFRPVGDATLSDVRHRTHRKILVCDEVVGFTGGVGIAEEWTGDARNPDEWRDTHFEVRGPAVDGLRAGFLQQWVETGPDLLDPEIDRLEPQERAGEVPMMVLPDGDQTGFSLTGLCFMLMLTGAEERIRVTTAYFTPDDDLAELICAASRRGVSVEVLVPGEHADKDFVRWAGERMYQQILDAGVSLHTFDPSMLHAKVMTADGRVAVVGSSNVNSRSVALDEEILMVIFDDEIIAELDAHFDDDLTRSSELDPADWAERGLLQRAREATTAMVKDLL